MTSDILRAVALLLVLEGILPFIAPGAFRLSLEKLAGMDEQKLRMGGLLAMLAGLLLLQAVHWLLPHV